MVRPLRNNQVDIAKSGDRLRAVSRVDTGIGEKTAAGRALGSSVGTAFETIQKEREQENEALDAVERVRLNGEYRATTARRIGELDPTSPSYEADTRRILDEGEQPLREGLRFNSTAGQRRFDLAMADTKAGMLANALAGRRAEAQRLTRITLDNALTEATAQITANPDSHASVLASLSAQVAGAGDILPEAERTRIQSRAAIAVTSARVMALTDAGRIGEAQRVVREAGRTGLAPEASRYLATTIRQRASEARAQAEVTRQTEQSAFLIRLSQGDEATTKTHLERLQSGYYQTLPNGMAYYAQAQHIMDVRERDNNRQARENADLAAKVTAGVPLNPEEATRVVTLSAAEILERAGPNADPNSQEVQDATTAVAIRTARTSGSLPRQLLGQWNAAEASKDPEQLARAAQQLIAVQSTEQGEKAARAFGNDTLTRQVLTYARSISGGQEPSLVSLMQAAQLVTSVPAPDRNARSVALDDFMKVEANRMALAADVTKILGANGSDPAWVAEYEKLVRNANATTGDITQARRIAGEELRRLAPRTYVGNSAGDTPRSRMTYESALGSEIKTALGYSGQFGQQNQQIVGAAMTTFILDNLRRAGQVGPNVRTFELRPTAFGSDGSPTEFAIWAPTATGAMAVLPGDNGRPRTIAVPKTVAEFEQVFPGLRAQISANERQQEEDRRNPQAAEERRDLLGRLQRRQRELQTLERVANPDETTARAIESAKREIEQLQNQTRRDPTDAAAAPVRPTTPGNIDLNARPRVQNRDGSVSTILSVGVNVDGKEVLIPRISDDGRTLSVDEAVALYRRTGKHLGMFDSPEDATAYAKWLSDQQGRRTRR